MKEKLTLLIITLFMLLCSHASGQTVIEMEKEGGVYKIPCEINGLRLKLIFDTGASNVCISGSIADMMLENGYLTKDDICGTGQSVVADGRIVDNTRVNIKELIIGGVKLSNVEAVVIHQQSAPLLLGQSAIQKLGSVSIYENKLIINEYASSPAPSKKVYTDAEIDELFDLAEEADRNNSYELAAEYYGILYSAGELSTYGKYRYADQLRASSRNTESLAVYFEVLNNIKDLSEDSQIWVYRGIQVCYSELGDHSSSIKYGQLALQKSTFASDARIGIVYRIAMCYDRMGDKYSSKSVINGEIQRYLKYMGIKATDCWDKEYKDPYIAQLYFYLYIYSTTNSDYRKYIMISAAWGYQDAIENAKEYNYPYYTKPSEYVY